MVSELEEGREVVLLEEGLVVAEVDLTEEEECRHIIVKGLPRAD
jgi:hypothetical protein